MTIPREALALIESFEGFHKELPGGRAAPYLCPARVPTIGIGSTFYEDGRPVSLDDTPITRERAYELLAYELRLCERSVDGLIVPVLHPLSRGALVSFVYNLGAGALKGSGLRRAVNAGDHERAASEFLKWRMAGGVVLKGLERRRHAEAELYLRGTREAADARLARDPALPAADVWNAVVSSSNRDWVRAARADNDRLPPGAGG